LYRGGVKQFDYQHITKTKIFQGSIFFQRNEQKTQRKKVLKRKNRNKNPQIPFQTKKIISYLCRCFLKRQQGTGKRQ
jgi:hypothetical protein